uniref:Uncharacterized protein n=1 Tax=Kalanchoe fedtschenkoi TaxID=63787 RepID=A0A7N0RBJ0_KALFE
MLIQSHLHLRIPPLHIGAASKPLNSRSVRCSISGATPNPARDRTISFGKHRGKMLGSLPSTYLQWISKNLRAGDTEHWATLADQVLEDPVYKDRIEWEFAEKVLNGDVLTTSASASSVEALLQISERFGWDNEDKIGWSTVNFELLGTSRGGRIPRVSDKGSGGGVGRLKKTAAKVRLESAEDRERERRREERRGRRAKGSLGNQVADGGGDDGESGGHTAAEIHNQFPGRESLLRKAMTGRQRIL